MSIARSRVQVGCGHRRSRTSPRHRRRARTPPLDDGLIGVLQAGLGTLRAGEGGLGADHADSGYVAVNEAGQPYTPGALTNMGHRLTETAGVRPMRLHDARNSCGTAMNLRAVPMAVIAKWLGHADASITAKIYAHSQDDELRAAGQTLGAVVTSS